MLPAELREINIRFTLSYHQLPPLPTCLVFFPQTIQEWNSLPRADLIIFFHRVTNDWNQLPATVVNSNSISPYKSLLDINLHDVKFIFV